MSLKTDSRFAHPRTSSSWIAVRPQLWNSTSEFIFVFTKDRQPKIHNKLIAFRPVPAAREHTTPRPPQQPIMELKGSRYPDSASMPQPIVMSLKFDSRFAHPRTSSSWIAVRPQLSNSTSFLQKKDGSYNNATTEVFSTTLSAFINAPNGTQIHLT